MANSDGIEIIDFRAGVSGNAGPSSVEPSGTANRIDVPAGYVLDEDGFPVRTRTRGRHTASSTGNDNPDPGISSERLLTEPKTRVGRKPKDEPVSAESIANLTSALFTLVSMARGPHWEHSPADCLVIANPLHDYLKHLPVKTRKDLEKMVLPFNIAIGAIALLQGPISYELQLAEVKKNGIPTRQFEAQTTGNGYDYNQPGTPSVERRYSGSEGPVQPIRFDDLSGIGEDTGFPDY